MRIDQRQLPSITTNNHEIQIRAPVSASFANILTPGALKFLAMLHREFNQTRLALLDERRARQAALHAGRWPDFRPETASVREGDWQVAPAPADLQQRWVEITGPVDRKMMINALNSGADVFMADFEDSLSPTWENVTQGQLNLYDAVRQQLTLEQNGKTYRLHDRIATLLVRPRGWHLDEPRLQVDGEPISASLFDFGLYFFHNAQELLARGSGPYFYLPKLENALEARLWNQVFVRAQEALGIPRGSLRATVLIENVLAAFEMDEILFELREHAAGLNAGRWDYIFSVIKKFRQMPDFVLPDRAQITMTAPFMRAYTNLLVQTCHKRGAHAIGGMAAFIPSRKDEAVNQLALARVREDKLRESRDGYDGTWIAHPDLVPVAKPVFESALGGKPHQKDRLRQDVQVTAHDLLDFHIEGGTITEEGLRLNINVSLLYLDSWLRGVGAAALYNLMEDTATAEISRAQVWQWIHAGARLADGRQITPELYRSLHADELQRINPAPGHTLRTASRLLDQLILSDEFIDFLTIPAMEHLSIWRTK